MAGNFRREIVSNRLLQTEPELPDQASDTVWDQMVFSFDLAGASLTLNSNERPLVSCSPLHRISKKPSPKH